MKKKLCPFDKIECAGELCMAFREDGHCGLVFIQNTGLSAPVVPGTENSPGRKADAVRKEIRERKSRYHAELFD